MSALPVTFWTYLLIGAPLPSHGLQVQTSMHKETGKNTEKLNPRGCMKSLQTIERDREEVIRYAHWHVSPWCGGVACCIILHMTRLAPSLPLQALKSWKYVHALNQPTCSILAQSFCVHR